MQKRLILVINFIEKQAGQFTPALDRYLHGSWPHTAPVLPHRSLRATAALAGPRTAAQAGTASSSNAIPANPIPIKRKVVALQDIQGDQGGPFQVYPTLDESPGNIFCVGFCGKMASLQASWILYDPFGSRFG